MQAETDPDSDAAGISYASRMNSAPLTMISRTHTGDPGWHGPLVKDDLPGLVARLKAKAAKDV